MLRPRARGRQESGPLVLKLNRDPELFVHFHDTCDDFVAYEHFQQSLWSLPTEPLLTVQSFGPRVLWFV